MPRRKLVAQQLGLQRFLPRRSVSPQPPRQLPWEGKVGKVFVSPCPEFELRALASRDAQASVATPFVLDGALPGTRQAGTDSAYAIITVMHFPASLS